MDIDDIEEMRLLDTIENDDGSLEAIFGDDADELSEYSPDALAHDANLAEYLSEEDLEEISSKTQNRYESDLASNKEFFDFINQQLPRLGLKIERVNEPFPDASPIVHPLILENAIKSQSKIMGEVFSGKNLVDVYVYATADEEVQQRANSIRKFMDWQYLVQMPEYMDETEQMVLRMLLTGNTFRKYSYDVINDRPKAYFVSEDRFIINSTAKTIHNADFHTEIISMPRHTYEGLILAGVFIGDEDDAEHNFLGAQSTETEQVIADVTGDAQGYEHDTVAEDSIELLEHHCYLELEEELVGEDRLLPYVVIKEAETGKIKSIRRNWRKADTKKQKRNWYAHYKMLPGLGFYGLGYLHLLGNFQFALTQIVRSLIDAGQFTNLQGGFRAKGVRWTKESRMPIRPGEFREIETQQRPINDVIYPLNFKEPSQVLYALFEFLDARAQKFADSSEQIIADSTNYGPVGTTVALLEASTKFMSGILKRFYGSLKDEFRILYELNYDTLDDQMTFFVKGETFKVERDFFSGAVDVVPAADPNMSSTAHRLSISNTKLQAALQAPQIHSLPAAYRDFYSNLGMESEEIDVLLPRPQEAQQADPMSDVIAASQGKPIKAFNGQDHDAHIAFKTAFMNDPQGGKNPLLQTVLPALQANIAEHQLMKYTERLNAAMQSTDPNAIGMEKAVAQAAEALKGLNQLEANVSDLAKGDPTALLAMAEVKNAETKAKEAETKAVLGAKKAEQDDQKIELDRLKLGQKDSIDRTKMKANLVSQDKTQGFQLVTKAMDLANMMNDTPDKK